MSRVPIEAGYFTIPDEPDAPPSLLGSRCGACGEHFFPRRVVCARCLAEGCDDVLLGPNGTVHTWTYVHVPFFAKKDRSAAAYAVAQVDLAEGPRVQAVVVGVTADEVRIGMPVTLDLDPLREDGNGNEVVIFCFRAASGDPTGGDPAADTGMVGQ